MDVATHGSTRTRKQASVRKGEIISAAIKIIGEKGYPGLTIQVVAARCGITHSGVMHHFASKNDILIEVLRESERRDEDALRSLRETAFAPLLDQTTARDLILSSMHAIVERNAGQPEILQLFTVLRAEAMNADHPAHTYFQNRMHAVLAVFSELFQQIADDAMSMARLFLALMHGLEAQWVSEGMAFDLLLEWDRAAERLLPP